MLSESPCSAQLIDWTDPVLFDNFYLVPSKLNRDPCVINEVIFTMYMSFINGNVVDVECLL